MSLSVPQPFVSLTDLGLEASSGQILQSWLTQMQAAFPGYEPSQGNLEYVLAQIFASFAADIAQQCAAGANALFEAYGTDLLNLPPLVGTSALAVIDVTAVDTAGYLLLGGTQVILTGSDGSPLGFQTTANLTIPPGSTDGTVVVAAIQPGSDFNGAGAPAQLNLSVDWVQGISVVTNSSSGIDAEDDTHYLNRLKATLQLLAPRPITASDYATMALDFAPVPGTDQQEVGRATAIDGYDPGKNTYGNEREVTVCVADANGLALDNDTLSAVQAWFTTLREVNFIVNVVNPNYSAVYVAVEVKAAAGWQATDVQAAIQANLLAYLNPASFGLPPNSTVGWTNYTSVYLSKIEAVIQNTSGVDYIFNGSMAVDTVGPPVNTTVDLALPGPFPLPLATALTIPLSAINVQPTGNIQIAEAESVTVTEHVVA